MIVSVTPLGDASGTISPGQVGTKIADYLQGVGLARGGRQAGKTIELPSLSGAGTVAYYADSTGIRPGRWLGTRSGDVNPMQLAALIAGVDPDSGTALRTSTNSARGRRRRVDLSVLQDGQDWYGTRLAAAAIGVKHTYLQRLVKAAADHIGAQANGGAPTAPSGMQAAALVAMESGLIEKSDGRRWLFHREALTQLAAARKPATTVVAYDVTFSLPKEVSLVWARGDDAVRSNVLSAIDHAVAAGITYLDRNALQVRVSGEQKVAHNWTGAEFLHLTSRALEPQLHKHILILNRAEDDKGALRALDGRLLFLHAKTASYLAEAELRHQLAARLGIEHGTPVQGIAPLLGVPAAVVAEFSTRSREITEATEALGVDSAAARQVAAYDTRSAKAAGFDFDEVTRWWGERMDALGFSEPALGDVIGRVEGPRVLMDVEIEEFNRRLLRVSGITENEARFDRRSVVQAVAEFAGERLSGKAIEDLADRFLTRDEVVPLETSRETSSRNVIRLADRRVVTVPIDRFYTTRSMLSVERRAMARYREGLGAGAGVVPLHVLDQVLAEPRFARLSDEQRAFVTELTTSGDRVQAGLGRAGSGKTTALDAAVAAWRVAGFDVLGSAVGGTQSVLLAEEATGHARTVASVLARYFDLGDANLITNRTVLLVDEASVLSTRDAGLLEQIITEHPGAILRLVGDEQQHSSVAAGGFFRWIIEEHPAHVPELRTVYRQEGEEMAEVRLALDEYREGKIAEALDRLERDGRIAEASSPEEAYDLLTCAWYAEHQRRADDPSRRLSSMTAEHHRERRELNRRARVLLKADGTLAGPELVVDGAGFQVHDEVIARVGDHDLRAEGASRDQWVRNGSKGVVREVGDDHLVVAFERWGEVRVPLSYIEREVVPGVRGGLMHSYALTTYAAQGATMATAMPLVTDASSREGVYVALTRPQFDLNAIAIRYDRIVPSPVDDLLPVVQSELSDLEATARALERDERERLASVIDPRAARVNELVTTMRLDELEDAVVRGGPEHELLARALCERATLIGRRGALDPAPEVLGHLGPRPSGRDERRDWDTAAGLVAIYRERERIEVVSDAPGVEWALGPRPDDPDAALEYDRLAALIEPLDIHVESEVAPNGSTTPTAVPEHSYAHLDDVELTAIASELRTSVDRQLVHLDDLGDGIELYLHLIDEGPAGAGDLSVFRRELDAERARYDEGLALYDELALGSAAIEREMADRGLELAEASSPSFTYHPDEVEPVMAPEAGPAAEQRGPEIEP